MGPARVSLDDLVALLRGTGRGVKTMLEQTGEFIERPEDTAKALMSMKASDWKHVPAAVMADVKERGQTPEGIGELLGENIDIRNFGKKAALAAAAGAAKAAMLPAAIAREGIERETLRAAQEAVKAGDLEQLARAGARGHVEDAALQIEKDTGWWPQIQRGRNIELFRNWRPVHVDMDFIRDVAKLRSRKGLDFPHQEWIKDPEYKELLKSLDRSVDPPSLHIATAKEGFTPGTPAGALSPYQNVVTMARSNDPAHHIEVLQHELNHALDWRGGTPIMDVGAQGPTRHVGPDEWFAYFAHPGELRARGTGWWSMLPEQDRAFTTPGEIATNARREMSQRVLRGDIHGIREQFDLAQRLVARNKAAAGAGRVSTPTPERVSIPRRTGRLTADEISKILEGIK